MLTWKTQSITQHMDSTDARGIIEIHVAWLDMLAHMLANVVSGESMASVSFFFNI